MTWDQERRNEALTGVFLSVNSRNSFRFVFASKKGERHHKVEDS